MELAGYLGRNVTNLLERRPFKDWPVEKSISDDLDETVVHYVFEANALELRCDSQNVVSVLICTLD
jgi:hypothetical protein